MNVAWRSLVHYIGGSEKTIAVLGDRWWPQTAKQEGDKISEEFLRNIWKNVVSAQNVGGLY